MITVGFKSPYHIFASNLNEFTITSFSEPRCGDLNSTGLNLNWGCLGIALDDISVVLYASLIVLNISLSKNIDSSGLTNCNDSGLTNCDFIEKIFFMWKLSDNVRAESSVLIVSEVSTVTIDFVALLVGDGSLSNFGNLLFLL